MLKDITTICLSGACFDSESQFDFFKGDKDKRCKGSLLYGRNGTGKSTIARAFRKLSGEDVLAIKSAELHDVNGKIIELTEDEMRHIFVYDEDYVVKNVKMQEDHLDTIVMLGPVADIDEKIKEVQSRLKEAKTQYDNQITEYSKYRDNTNPYSPQHYINQMVDKLRGDGNWADRDKEIKGNKVNSAVKADTYQQFVDITPSKTRDELILEYSRKLEELMTIRKGDQSINIQVPAVPTCFTQYDDEEVQNLLAKKIEKPELSEREKKILQLLNDSEDVHQRLAILKSEETIECPYCYQPLTPQYKKSIVESIEKVLSEEVKNHQIELHKSIVDEIILDLKAFEKLEGYKECTELIAEANKEFGEINAKLEVKVSNPYEPIIIRSTGRLIAGKLSEALSKLENVRLSYNIEVNKTDAITQELHSINNAIAHYDIIEDLRKYKEQLQKFKEAETKCKEAEKAHDSIAGELNDLEAMRKNIHIAVDSINACLKYIFFTEDRMRIVFDGENYKLMSHGKSVRPSDISVGERNIIGLCYFFTSIMEGQEEATAYGNEYLFVIDDPVSSYDMENRVGILSFLKYKLSLFLEGNEMTKAVVMTHDIMTFYETDKVFEEIMVACKDKSLKGTAGSTYTFTRLEIENYKFTEFHYKKRHEYSELLKEIYYFACDDSESGEMVIGNIMRQALEAFSTFVYKQSIENVSTDKEILNTLPDKKYVRYYENLMYRLVLHGGSHKEEMIKSMNDLDFFDYISTSEKRRTAKDILCFIYLLNKIHLLAHLKECNDVEHNLESWCCNIKSRCGGV